MWDSHKPACSLSVQLATVLWLCTSNGCPVHPLNTPVFGCLSAYTGMLPSTTTCSWQEEASHTRAAKHRLQQQHARLCHQRRFPTTPMRPLNSAATTWSLSLEAFPPGEPAHKLRPACTDPAQIEHARPSHDLILWTRPIKVSMPRPSDTAWVVGLWALQAAIPQAGSQLQAWSTVSPCRLGPNV